MDISKICIDVPEAEPISTTTPKTIPSIQSGDQLPSINNYVNNASDTNYSGLQTKIQHNKALQYQLHYQRQHQYLKSYSSTDQTFFQDQSNNNRPQYRPNISPSLSTSPNNPKPIAPQPPLQHHQSSSSSSVTTASSLTPSASASAPLPPAQKDNALSHIIEQCTFVYQQISKYRTDPLREAERNQIIESVFETTEKMLKSLTDLDEDTNAYDNDQSSAQVLYDNTTQASYMVEEDSAPPSGNESASEEYKMIRQARNLQKNTRPKYRRRSRTNMAGHRCHSCNTTDTPEWRRGPDGARTLCNACGLHYSKLLRKGSLTVQTHNYTLGAPPGGTAPQSRAIQFPIIQVNHNENPTSSVATTANTNTTIHTNYSATQPSSLSSSVYQASPRIVEVKEDEQEDIEMK